jgi:hypothetical protein
LPLDSAETGLDEDGGDTMVNVLWILQISCAALRSRELPNPLNDFGLLVSVTGILTVLLTSLALMAVVYGLSLIFWFAWLGVVMLRKSPV